MTESTEVTAYLVRGDDATVTSQEARGLVQRLVGDRDPALVVEEHGWTADELDIGRVVDALVTPPFLVDRRVVVVREAGRLNAADAGRLAQAIGQSPSSCLLVLVGGGGTVPQALVKAVGKAGVINASIGTGRDRTRWLSEHLGGGPVRLTAGARQLVAQHLGEDLGRVDQLLQTLQAAYGDGAAVSEVEIEPFLGEAGSVPPWELTDAVDGGQMAAALVALRRMTGAGARSAPEIVALLHRHFDQMLRLDRPGLSGPEEAAGVLGVRSTFVAKKALGAARRLGPERVAEAIVLLAEADQDIKGRSGLPAQMVLEVLVARLGRLSRSAAPAGRVRRSTTAATGPRSPGGR